MNEMDFELDFNEPAEVEDITTDVVPEQSDTVEAPSAEGDLEEELFEDDEIEDVDDAVEDVAMEEYELSEEGEDSEPGEGTDSEELEEDDELEENDELEESASPDGGAELEEDDELSEDARPDDGAGQGEDAWLDEDDELGEDDELDEDASPDGNVELEESDWLEEDAELDERGEDPEGDKPSNNLEKHGQDVLEDGFNDLGVPEDDEAGEANASSAVELEEDGAEGKTGERSDGAGPHEGYETLSDYMNAHNYGRDDFDTYSKDPEWQRLHKEEFPEWHSDDTPSDNELDAFGDPREVAKDEGGQASSEVGASIQEGLGEDFADRPMDTSVRGKSITEFLSGIFGKPADADQATEINSLPDSEAELSPEELADLGFCALEPDEIEGISAIDCSGSLSDAEADLLATSAQKAISNVFESCVDIPAPADVTRAANYVSGEEYAEIGGSPNSFGFYSPSRDEIVINVDAHAYSGSAELLATTVHEGLHRSSGRGMYAPFAFPNTETVDWNTLPLGLDEGITEMISIDAVNGLGIDYKSRSYPGYVEGARMLCEAMGGRMVREAYLTATPENLRREFESAFASKDELEGYVPGQFSTNGKYVELLRSINAMGDYHPGSEGYAEARSQLAGLLERYRAGKRAQQGYR